MLHETNELVHVFTQDGTEIVTTPTHPFYSPIYGWTAAIDLRAGDTLVTVNGERVVVEEVTHELLENPVTVYNFEVEGLHTYFVGAAGVLVHNNCGTKPVSPKKVSDSYIKTNKIDAHAFKAQNGAGSRVAHWDYIKILLQKERYG